MLSESRSERLWLQRSRLPPSSPSTFRTQSQIHARGRRTTHRVEGEARTDVEENIGLLPRQEQRYPAGQVLYQAQGQGGDLDRRYGTRTPMMLLPLNKPLTWRQVGRLRHAMHEYESEKWRIISSKVGHGFSAAACQQKAEEMDLSE